MHTTKTMLHVEGTSTKKFRPRRLSVEKDPLPAIYSEKHKVNPIFENFTWIPPDQEEPCIVTTTTVPHFTENAITIPSVSRETTHAKELDKLEEAIVNLQDQSVTIYDELKRLSYIITGLNSKITQLHAIIEKSG